MHIVAWLLIVEFRVFCRTYVWLEEALEFGQSEPASIHYSFEQHEIPPSECIYTETQPTQVVARKSWLSTFEYFQSKSINQSNPNRSLDRHISIHHRRIEGFAMFSTDFHYNVNKILIQLLEVSLNFNPLWNNWSSPQPSTSLRMDGTVYGNTSITLSKPGRCLLLVHPSADTLATAWRSSQWSFIYRAGHGQRRCQCTGKV